MPSESFDQKLKKAGFSSLLEMAIHLPISYLDTRLSSELSIGEAHTIEAEIVQVSRLPKRLVATARTPLCDRPIEITIFHPKPYHGALFKPGMRHFLQGKIDRYGSKLQLVNPKKISKTGEIVPQYRCKLRQDVHRRIVESLVTVANLVGEGLDEERAALIVRAHRPDDTWLKLYRRHGGVGPKTVEALKFAEALDHFKRLGGKRVRFPATARLDGSAEPFVKRLPFELTDDQKRAIEAIRADLSGETAARRMIVGDVGSGKTMVILAAATMAYPHKAVLMAPTSILARQLYEEAKKWLPDFVDVALVTQSREAGEMQTAHLIVGTHALLYRDLPEAPLIMVDEQHRFGTEQRKMLERLVSKNRPSSKKAKPHFLQFSATPIPRTQAMMESALIDVTLIESTPFVKDISTHIVDKSGFTALLGHIRTETEAGRQVLVVYPLVEESEHIGYRSIEESEAFWKARFDGVHVTHGRDKNKDDVLQAFAEKGKILLATTVIEVGISLPKLSTIVIVGAERMGLATLHQLRGRVSRTGLKGYCFLFTHDVKNERLQSFAKTANGFEIARLDLKFRKSGDLLRGKMQSGKEFVWLDMGEDEKIVEAAKRRADGR
ncbi:ATP-dependent DNA helicase RecG [Hydrogenimonas cancrithermarum]|uniref:ATP-dependent DNA helicase RecG n=1 Tax=Hydrogenimonas cancrithermarum TaxID=2993563 RepID=A0ABM8FMC3_9BACT|nr:ATP-dependent DNA helicase RecG [Hydrogenimonas cancrithermarum]BDY13499.1 ATP-dependent DNA helicase RecG [Hydrogenimonas cancrithermarum]